MIATSASADRFISRLLLILSCFQKLRWELDAALLSKFEQIDPKLKIRLDVPCDRLRRTGESRTGNRSLICRPGATSDGSDRLTHTPVLRCLFPSWRRSPITVPKSCEAGDKLAAVMALNQHMRVVGLHRRGSLGALMVAHLVNRGRISCLKAAWH